MAKPNTNPRSALTYSLLHDITDFCLSRYVNIGLLSRSEVAICWRLITNSATCSKFRAPQMCKHAHKHHHKMPPLFIQLFRGGTNDPANMRAPLQYRQVLSPSFCFQWKDVIPLCCILRTTGEAAPLCKTLLETSENSINDRWRDVYYPLGAYQLTTPEGVDGPCRRLAGERMPRFRISTSPSTTGQYPIGVSTSFGATMCAGSGVPS